MHLFFASGLLCAPIYPRAVPDAGSLFTDERPAQPRSLADQVRAPSGGSGRWWPFPPQPRSSDSEPGEPVSAAPCVPTQRLRWCVRSPARPCAIPRGLRPSASHLLSRSCPSPGLRNAVPRQTALRMPSPNRLPSEALSSANSLTSRTSLCGGDSCLAHASAEGR